MQDLMTRSEQQGQTLKVEVILWAAKLPVDEDTGVPHVEQERA
jgi:hypothetical protein